MRFLSLLLPLLAVAAVAQQGADPEAVQKEIAGEVATFLTRAQRDTVGFATSEADFATVLAASLAAEGVDPHADAVPAVAAIVPHDDYLYAGRTAVHALPHLQARRWIVFGVCHACRRLGQRDTLITSLDTTWRVAGRDFEVDLDLQSELQALVAGGFRSDDERHDQEHSIEALLPWLGAAVQDPLIVPILVPGMEPDDLHARAACLADALATVCRARGWVLGRDLGILISADAVHYGCEGWGGSGYAPFGCDAAGHAAARGQDLELVRTCLSGPVTDLHLDHFMDRVWDRDHPDYPAYPYRITWCGLYSIPFGLAVASRLAAELEGVPLEGRLLRYGDSVSDGELELPDTRLGVTAPGTLNHWVGYVTAVYTARPNGDDGALEP